MNTLTTYRFKLDPSPKKFTCPLCGQKKFVRYIDSETGEYQSEELGRCDRENNCGYHLKPNEANEAKINTANNDIPITKPIDFFLPATLEKSMIKGGNNCFIEYLKTLFGETVSESLVQKYAIGTSKHIFTNIDFPDYLSSLGSTVFWQVDEKLNIRYGKVMLYNPETGRRVKDPFSHIVGAHYLIPGMKKMNFEQVFFGQHLLYEHPEKPIGIVESEKTAVICSFFMPQINWLATGGVAGAKWGEYSVYKILEGKEVTLFPDFGIADNSGKTPFIKWKEKANHISSKIKCDIRMSEILEKKLPMEDRLKGLDIADLLIKQDQKTGIALTEAGYPIIWDRNSGIE